MANPGPYPPMGGPMQPMGGPPLGPMGIPREPIRQGTSHVVPVVVSAGLAVGVFCGLLFGLGTGRHEPPTEPSRGSSVKQTDDSLDPDVPESVAGNSAPSQTIRPGESSNTGSAATAAPGAGSNAGSAAPEAAGSTAPEVKSVKLTVAIKPDSAVPVAKISVDGKPISGTTVDIPLDPGATQKTVHVQVEATGFKDGTRDVDVFARDPEISVPFELEPTTGRTGGEGAGTPSRESGGGTPSSGSKGGKSRGRGSKTSKSGLIDI